MGREAGGMSNITSSVSLTNRPEASQQKASSEETASSYKQVQEIQDRIDTRLSEQFQGLKLQMPVQHINVSIVSGHDVLDPIDLQQIPNEAQPVGSNQVCIDSSTSIPTEGAQQDLTTIKC